MRNSMLILLLGLSTLTFAQASKDTNTWIIKGNTTSLIDIYTFPTAQLSIEKEITDYFSVNTEVGYQLYDLRRNDTSILKPHGFKVNIELRYYFSGIFSEDLANKLDGFYLGLQPFYRRYQYTATISYYPSLDATITKDDNLGVKKTIYGLNCILGFQKPVSNKVIIDLYIGLGIMERFVKNTNRHYNMDSDIAGTDLLPLFQSLHLSESSGITGNFLFGLRLGYKL